MGRSLRIALAVFFGGVAGSSLRFAAGELLINVGFTDLVPILVVNSVGALALGWFAERARHAAPWSTPMVAFGGVGLLGSFTTFSAFSVESMELLRSGSWAVGSAYMIVSVGVGLFAARHGKRMAASA